jgi:ABC-type multidrug transport system permease subunit
MAASFTRASAFTPPRRQAARSVQGLGALIMLPLSFASNVFVPASTMPGWLQAFVNVNPVS